MARRTKRVVCLGDFHCGHAVGLTPLAWQFGPINFEDEDEKADSLIHNQRRERFRKLQQDCWAWYTKTIKSLQPIDVLIANGDMIDGTGYRSGGTEQVTTDRQIQADMAVVALRKAKAKRYCMTYGTASHTGEAEDFESIIAQKMNATIGSHEWIDINGLVFDVKHHLGSSGVPHGRHTAVAKDRLWNILWSEKGEQPKAQIFIRSHVHYHQFVGGPDWLAMTLPALQAAGTKYGARRCSGTVDYGLVHFDVSHIGAFSWQAHLAKLESQKAQALVV